MTDREFSNFPDGSIVKVVYTNFLTYDNVVLTPGSNLNLIIGTNGSGKSSVICGICLAVGGSPKTLGRSDKLGDYIKHGSESGSVEVSIADSNKGPQSFKIVLSKPNSSEYFFNGKSCSASSIRERATDYNIQIDNPCTFLAQDKVKSFSEQNAKLLLLNTERAGDTELMKKHEELIERKKEEGKLDFILKDLGSRLKNTKNEHDQLVPIVENYKKAQALKTRLHALKKKRCILKFQHSEEKFRAADKHLDELRNLIKKKHKEIDKQTVAVKNKISKRTSFSQNRDNLDAKIGQISTQISRNLNGGLYEDSIREATDKYRNTKQKAESYRSELKELENEINKLTENIEVASNDLSGYQAFKVTVSEKQKSFEDETNELKNKEFGIEQQRTKVRQQYMDLSTKKSQFSHELNDRLSYLMDRQNHIYETWRWYKQNENQFQHPVYFPFVDIIIRRDNAKFIENVVNQRDILMFICGSQNDESLLAKGAVNITKGRGVNTTVVNPQNVNRESIYAKLPDELKNYGFRSLLSEMFTAPDVVKHYLCEVSRIHKVPVGNEKVDDISEETAKDFCVQRRISVLLSPSQRISTNVSKYSGNAILNISQLRPPQMFLKHEKPLPNYQDILAKTDELKNMENHLREQTEKVRCSLKEIDQRKHAIREEMMTWKNKRTRVETLKVQLEHSKANYENKIAQKPNIETAKKEFEEKRLEAFRNAKLHVADFVKKQRDLLNIRVERHLVNMICEAVSRDLHDNDYIVRTLQEEVRKFEAILRNEQEKLLELKMSVEETKKDMISECGLNTIIIDEMTAEEKKKWNLLQKNFVKEGVPEALMDVDDQIIQENAKSALANKQGTENDVVRLEEVKIELAKLIEENDIQTANKGNWQNNMKDAIMEWRHPIERLVANINRNYQNFFQKLGKGCSGEVSLEIPENELDIESYGIMIMVSFRENEPLRRLDHQVQSGGERSVSTMLYLLSLQELCPVPFRCVDEINQGMDPTNERKVFDLMVAKLTGDGNLAKTQYFLLTPKLLCGLNYNEKVTIQVVHNGPFLNKNAWQWEHSRFLEIMKQRAGAISG